MKKCKHCQSEIDDKAKICPNCNKKQGSAGKTVLIVVGVIVALGVIGNLLPDDETTGGSGGSADTSSGAETTAPIEYTEVNLKDMFDALNENALKAEKEYQDAYIKFTGAINNIDSDGSYITVKAIGDDWGFDRVQCYITDDSQLDFIIEKKVGDTVTVSGKVKSIGELLGYSLDIYTIE